MADFNAIQEGLNRPARPKTVEVSLVTLGSVNTSNVSYGTTIADFKRANGLGDANIANADGEVLANSAVITKDMELFVSTPKRNG